MHNNRPHPLLEQVPLTVSPFVPLPTATTLSYNYKNLPSNIPPSSLGVEAASDDPSTQSKPKYVKSPSGHAAHPDDILESCRALNAHITKMQEDAEQELKDLEERIKERELAEKRRLAPGWLDSESRLLEPEKAASAQKEDPSTISAVAPATGQDGSSGPGRPKATAADSPSNDEGAQLDRAFGGMAIH